MTDNPKPEHWNISKTARWGLKQALGTKRGDQLIHLIEDDVPQTWAMLESGDYEAFLAGIPVQHLAGLIAVLAKKGGVKL